jgi:hypothetical protein
LHVSVYKGIDVLLIGFIRNTLLKTSGHNGSGVTELIKMHWSISRRRIRFATLLLTVTLFQYSPLVLLLSKGTSFLELQTINEQLAHGPPQSSAENSPSPNFFEWKCIDSCSCLPQAVYNGTSSVIMHQSYKTSDPLHWHHGWRAQRQTYIDLHPSWTFIFWNDTQNLLLANCTGYADVFEKRSGIQQADLARLLYLYQYGGFYADLDYIALRNHDALFQLTVNETVDIRSQQLLLQGRYDQVVGLEWGYARQSKHPLWAYCLDIAHGQIGWKKRQGCPIYYTGPNMLNRCIKQYFQKKDQDLKQMVSYGQNDLMILEPSFIAPVSGTDFTSDCGQWRNESILTEDDSIWVKDWPKSSCMRNLTKTGAFAVTLYSHSWGQGLKC